MKAFLDKEYDMNVAKVPIGQWAIAARPLGLRVPTAFFENIELGGPITFPRLRKTERAE